MWSSSIGAFGANIRRNIDSAPAHIRPAVQNIVLKFGPINDIWNVTEPEILAASVAQQGAATQSARWCPLIWRALALCYNDIPAELTNANPESHAIVDPVAQRLARVPGWCQYARAVLTHNFPSIPDGAKIEIKFKKYGNRNFNSWR